MEPEEQLEYIESVGSLHANKDYPSLEENQVNCRICLEQEGIDFINPCTCSGSLKYVHETCMRVAQHHLARQSFLR